jgi:Peroxiredoxin
VRTVQRGGSAFGEGLWQAYKGKGVVVIGVAVWAEGDAFQRAREFVNKHKLTYTVLVDASEDGKVAQLYGVEGVPTNVVIGKDGKIRYLQAGFNEVGA